MSGFVYLWFDKKHHRYYVGSHWGSETDRYICSSHSMREAHRRRPDDFKRRIISRVSNDRQKLRNEEQRWLDMIMDSELGVRYYNKRRIATRNPIGIKFPNRKRPSTPNYAKGKTNPKLKAGWKNTRQKYPCVHCEKLFYKAHLNSWHGDLCLSNPNLDIDARNDQINRRMANSRTDAAQMKKSIRFKNQPQARTKYCELCQVWTPPHTHARYHRHEMSG